jgi:AcrR family transcriptional regulator
VTASVAPSTADTRDAILTAAQAEFGARGFKGATLKRIAARAGVSPALVYHYYRDKDDLFRAVVAHIADQLLAAPGLTTAVSDDLPAVLARFVESYLTIIQRPETIAFVKFGLQDIGHFPEFQEAIRTVGPGRLLAFLTAFLEAQRAAGRITVERPALAARMMMGSLAATVAAVRLFGLPPTGDERPDIMVPMLLRMLGAVPLPPDAGREA